jgi:hypothetical protein
MNWFEVSNCKVMVFFYISLVVVLMVLHYKVAGCGVWVLVTRSVYASIMIYIFTHSKNLRPAGALKHVVDYEEGGGTISRILSGGDEEESDHDVVKL